MHPIPLKFVCGPKLPTGATGEELLEEVARWCDPYDRGADKLPGEHGRLRCNHASMRSLK